MDSGFVSIRPGIFRTASDCRVALVPKSCVVVLHGGQTDFRLARERAVLVGSAERRAGKILTRLCFTLVYSHSQAHDEH